MKAMVFAGDAMFGVFLLQGNGMSSDLPRPLPVVV
jgi:hypothetical protein